MSTFEQRFAAMVKQAKQNEKTRTEKPRVKEIPSHIRARLDEEQNRYGMYNYRLDSWVREEFAEDHTTFRYEDQAIDWYRSLI